MARSLLLFLYFAASLGLFLYGANCYVMLVLFLRRRRQSRREGARIVAAAESHFAHPETLPVVTTQIPLYNEANVAERGIHAVAAIDYPWDLHQIQVLDDSTDGTRAIVDRLVAELRAAGHWITVLRRTDRRPGRSAGRISRDLRCRFCSTPAFSPGHAALFSGR